MTLRERLREVAGRLRRGAARRLGVDLRALGALRVALGGLLLADLLLRARSAAFLYTDTGALPRAALSARYPLTSQLSLHTLFGGVWWTTLLFVAAGVAAVSLAAGYRTRAAAVCSWLLLVSLHARNPLVLNGGDSLLRRTLLWSLFLPLGAGLSTRGGNVDGDEGDAADGGGDEHGDGGPSTGHCRHPAAAALLVQPVVVYVVNAAIKLRGDPWTDGTAVRLVFGMESLTVAFGQELAGYPGLLGVVATAWVVLLCCAPLLLLTTGRARTAVTVTYAVAHLGMALTLGLGLFPLISVAVLLPFLPSGVWDGIERRGRPVVSRLRAAGTAMRIGGKRRGPASASVTDGPSSRVTRGASRRIARGAREVGRIVAAALLVGVLVWNAAALGHVAVPETVDVTPEETRWDMFAPSPPTEDVWYVAPATLGSGETVDAIRGGDVRWTRPDGHLTSYPSARWRKYLEGVRWSDDERLRRRFASALCARWNAAHDGPERMEDVTVYAIHEPTRLDGAEPARRIRGHAYECPDAE